MKVLVDGAAFLIFDLLGHIFIARQYFYLLTDLLTYSRTEK